MSYTQKRFPNKESEFPAPPRWLLWSEYYQDGRGGQIRHLDTLQKAKKYVSPYVGNQRRDQVTFRYDWSIYEWDGAKWVERYSAKAGDKKIDNPLFRKRVSPKGEKVRDVAEDDLAAALASVMAAVKP